MAAERHIACADSAAPAVPAWRSVIELAKPNIVVFCLLMTAGGIFLAQGEIAFSTALMAMIGTGLAVAAANALNMYLERDSDAMMGRTRGRPLPSGRLRSAVALIFGVVLSFVSIVMLWIAVNPLSALLAAFAINTYVLLYTPMKQRSHWALVVGTVPGAMPALIGWTAAAGHIELPGLVLFAILAIWQIPHFIAIALYRKHDYARAGIKVLPIVKGDAAARRQALLTTVALLPVSWALVPLGTAGWLYAIIASAAGGMFLWSAVKHLLRQGGIAGARRFFFASLVYLPMIGAALICNLVLR